MALQCSYCGEEVEDESIRKGEDIYCSQACAFEAGRSTGCDDRADSTVSVSST